MIYISHRGNIRGKVLEMENKPTYIMNAIKAGYDVEIDVWYQDGKIVLGHDEPQYEVDLNFLSRPSLWSHAKSIEAFEYLHNNLLRCFLHTYEDLVVTNRGDLWTYPGKHLIKNSIAVLPETVKYSINELKNCYAICSDEVQRYKKMLK